MNIEGEFPTPKPELALNRSNPRTTVAEDLNNFITYAAEGLLGETSLATATAYFDVGGYTELADSLDLVDRVRLLIGAEPSAPRWPPRQISQASGASDQQSENEPLQPALLENEESLVWSRNLLQFTPEICHTIQRLLGWLKSGKVEVRRLEDRFLHAKAFLIEQNHHGVIAGSSNFTKAGLTSNIELNLGNYSPSIVEQVADFFDELWDQALDYDLASIFEFSEPHPYLVYLRMLWERYHPELQEEESLHPSLTQFQQHGLIRAQRILEKYGGVLIADEVGLGKTYIAGELIKQTISNKQRALVVAPAILRDGMWEGFIKEMDFGRRSVQVMSYEDMVSKVQDKDPALAEMALVVADEAHYLRNHSTKRAEAFNKLMNLGGNKKLALLTATPINNTLWDLFTLFDNILRAGGYGDAALSEIGIKSLRNRFAEAAALEVEALEPKHLFEVIDELSVRRMRQFIKKHYKDDTFKQGDKEQKINFPRPNVEALNYDIDSLLPGFFDRFAVALNVEGDLDFRNNQNVLTLARYIPSRYLKKPEERHYELALSGLMRSLLLKRFESSPHAFAKSCQRMIERNELFLGFLSKGKVVSKELLAGMADSSSDDLEQILEDQEQGTLLWEDEDTDEAAKYEEPILRNHIERDNRILKDFADSARGVKHEEDPTLRELEICLKKIAQQAGSKSDSLSSDRRKVLIFSYYADTVDWIFEYLQTKVSEPNSPIACYKDRIAKLSGKEKSKYKSRVLQGFAPKTASQGEFHPDLYDIVIATDILAEGVNLQQAQHIINYDLPWNPMRLVQRHGRIDRIGSPHDEVFLYCTMPDTRLEELLELEKKLRKKIGQANATMGLGRTLPGQESSIEVIFSDSKEELAKISQGNAELFENAGTGATALSGEQFRQELREAMRDRGREIEDLPWRSGTGMLVNNAANGTSKTEPGFVFCARVGDSRNIQYRFVSRAAACNFVSQAEACDEDSSVSEGIISETLDCLFLARPEAGWDTEAVPQNVEHSPNHNVFHAWTLARDHIVSEWNKLANKKAVEPDVPRRLREAGELLRDHPPPGLDKQAIDKAVMTVQAPLLEAGKQAITKIMRKAEEDKTEVAKQIMAAIDELGLKPYRPALPNPKITGEDVYLICWLALVDPRGSSK